MKPAAKKRGRPKNALKPVPTASIQALDRAIDVLEALSKHEGVTLTKLAEHLRQSPATMYRVLTTLERRDYVECDIEQQTWFVGPELFRLGSAFLLRTDIVERSRPVMRNLMARSGETSNLGIECDGNVLFLSQIETHESIRAFFPPGTRSPLHASGIGKALLSALDEDGLTMFLKSAQLTGFTDKTITSAEHIREDVRLARQRGYALDDEERTAGMRCVAAPIVNSYGEGVAGLSVSGPTNRMTDSRVCEIGQWVVEAAAKVSRHLGAK